MAVFILILAVFMPEKNKKLVVFNQLKNQMDAISLPELLQILGKGYSERTVRRWLAELVADNLVEKTGQKRGTRYCVKPLEQQRTVRENIYSNQSQKILQYVHQPLFKRKPVTYNLKWFERYRPNSTAYIPNASKEKLFQAGRRDSAPEPAGTYARKIYNRLLIDLSYNSSRLEGNTYSLLDTTQLIFSGVSAAGKLDEEKIMILNHKEAIRYLIDNARRLQINESEIFTLHYLLADGLVPSQYAGKIRDHGVRISNCRYIPLENKSQLQKQLIQICLKANSIDDPYEQSFFLLVHLAYLQAFTDVNKRTSRLSANIPLIVNNLVPLSFNDIAKDDYIDALIAIYELNEITPLLEIYIYSYLQTCQAYNATAEAVGFDEIRVRYREQRREIIRKIISENLHGDTMLLLIHDGAQKIKKVERKDFIQDIEEDLQEISKERIVGLGLSMQQLNKWLKKRDYSQK
jgi:Fic family protein